MKKGSSWSFDECYLAVWIYDTLDSSPSPGTKTSLYNKIADIIRRTPDSVEFKVQNVAAIDKRQANEKPIAGLNHYQVLLKTVYEWYWVDRKSSRLLYDLVALRITNQKDDSSNSVE
ncbi:MAG: hypothetical protein M0P20_04065 [Methanocorpusculum sp.]|jgi:hypothetical protein|nr:hypothetical protein [Methanocorpusculum sp.]MDD2286127.1 hypothetical protein [Paludibacter sp.]MDD4428932.1 hypothetical protein [Paludibacter sp.]